MLTLTRPGCQVIDQLFSFCRFKTTHRFCMVLWFLFWEPCLWICFFSVFVLNSCLLESLCGSSCRWTKTDFQLSMCPTRGITSVSTCNPRFAYVNYTRMIWERMWTIFSWMLASQKCQDLRFDIWDSTTPLSLAARQDHQLARCGFEHVGGNWKTYCSFLVDSADSWVEIPNVWPSMSFPDPPSNLCRCKWWVWSGAPTGRGRILNGKQGQTIHFIQLRGWSR